ncbi:LysR family transcriptional regulator [Endozoicomonas arenosclerae]|uniref:LysR family transcriptional regulator n=1 Tax=Endozoicomonas arenosclerae TaxID=1633495 RepID=UPI0015610876|nr:LysR family transcriptional regulator [Endozoicomonas arenosclerae]
MAVENLSSSDLNLLPVLQVLLEERSVTRAAGRLNLTQPAISRSLARLRKLFNDPLFTRTPQGLAPTPRAEAVALGLQQSLQDIVQLIEPPQFIPLESQHSFRLATTDYGAQVLLPEVVKRLSQEAPGVSLEIIPWRQQLLHELDAQSVDLATCTITDAPAVVHGRGVGQDKFVCVVRSSHPLVASGMDVRRYASHSHALITMGGERKGAVDYLLEEQGLTRNVVLRVPHFVAALALVANTDYILTVPYGLARSCASHYDLRILPFPLEQKPFTYSIIWHERYMKEPAHIWFRQLIYEELTRVIGELQEECCV